MGPRVHRNENEDRLGGVEYCHTLRLFTSSACSLYILGSLCSKLLASGFRLLRWNEDEVVFEKLEGFSFWESSASCFFLVIDILQILSHNQDPILITAKEGAYHDQGVLDAKDGIARKPLITSWIKSGDQFSVTGGLDCDMDVIRPHVMTIEVSEQLPNRTLIAQDQKHRLKSGWDRRTSPGIAYATGTTPL